LNDIEKKEDEEQLEEEMRRKEENRTSRGVLESHFAQ